MKTNTQLYVLTGCVVTVTGLVLSALMIYWIYFRVDYIQLADNQIASQWIGEAETVPAVSFFSAGGRFIDTADTPADQSIDQQTVMPLIQLLEQQANMKWAVSLSEDDPTRAYALVARLTAEVDEQQLDRIVAAAKAKYEGRILLLEGDEWISLEFTLPPNR